VSQNHATTEPNTDAPAPGRRHKLPTPLSAHGEPMVWLTGGALTLCLVMILGLLGLVVWQGLGTFWPLPLVRVVTPERGVVMGEITRDEWYSLREEEEKALLESLPAEAARRARETLGEHDGELHRLLFRTGNFELTNEHFRWVEEHEITERATDPWATVVERLEWGRFYGTPQAYALVHAVEAGPKAKRRREPPGVQRREAKAVGEKLAAELEPAEGARIEYFVERIVDAHPERLLIEPDRLRDTDLLMGVAEVWCGSEAAWEKYKEHHEHVVGLREEREDLEKVDVGHVMAAQEEARLDIKRAELDTPPPPLWLSAHDALARARRREEIARDEAEQYLGLVEERHGADSEELEKARHTVESERAAFAAETKAAEQKLADVEKKTGVTPDEYLASYRKAREEMAAARERFHEIRQEIEKLAREMDRHLLEMKTADGHVTLLKLADIVRAYTPNRLDFGDKAAIYASRWWEFLTDDPREANSEGGVWPAIVGTITMTLIMSLAVVPFGVLAALFLREYAKAGFIVSLVRIAINNLAGVPSIVFGVFGLGFFCYLVGAYIDGGPRNVEINPWPPMQWWLVLGGTVLVGVAAFFLGIVSAVRAGQGQSRLKRLLGRLSIALWLATVACVVLLFVFTPHFQGMFRARLADNKPMFGTDGLLWAALTLALLTAPVVIVATEEALAAVPNSMREGSYACGASKWQTIRRIVLPRAMPGIMTGMILAIARGAGEVAPLMLVGAEKLAPALPVNGEFPFVHLNRTFMHLGFHIYDLGFQSPNAEAAKPMVYSTTLLLILIIALLNVAAVLLRKRLRKKFVSAQF
jgi:ABC-type phosphate transport system permease subunit